MYECEIDMFITALYYVYMYL